MSYRISTAALNRAVAAAGPNGDAVAKILFEDIGRPVSNTVQSSDGPMGTYHRNPPKAATKVTAAVEGADAPETVPDTEPAPEAA